MKTIEQKAKAYDKAISLIKDYNRDEEGFICVKPENIFPELAESEGERIRKRLIELIYKVYANTNYITCVEHEQILAWLEKQGSEPIDKEKILIGARKDIALSIMNFLDNNSVGMCLSNMECKDLEDAVVNSKWTKLYNYMKKKLEKQGEQEEPQVYVTEDGEIITYSETDGYKVVEPKFKVGDWVVQDNIGVYKVIEVCESWYEVIDTDDNHYSIGFDQEHMCHLWTIQDAKDGDVLYFSDRTIVIFKDLYNATTFHSYCHIEDGLFGVSKDDVPDWWEGKGFQPATKEQRDLLFQKMKDAGYEWDADKKDDTTIAFENEEAYKIGFSDGEAYAKEEMTSAWSEEDGEMVEDIIEAIDTQYAVTDYNEMVNWLKSIKDRVFCEENFTTMWKPSDEQMEALKEACDEHWEPDGLDPLYTLYQDLKKLKG